MVHEKWCKEMKESQELDMLKECTFHPKVNSQRRQTISNTVTNT